MNVITVWFLSNFDGSSTQFEEYPGESCCLNVFCIGVRIPQYSENKTIEDTNSAAKLNEYPLENNL